MADACTCLDAVALHSGHCCMAELPDDWQPGDDHCHKADWDALCDRLSAERGDADRDPLPGQEALL